MSEMEDFNLFEDLLPMGSLTGLSGSVEEVDEFGYLGNVFPGDSQIAKMAPKNTDPCDNILDLLSIENAEDAFKDGWMENVDLSHFLDGVDTSEVLSHDQIVSSTPANVITMEDSNKPNGAMNILHGLLTQPMEQITPPTSPEAQVAPELSQIDLLEAMTEESSINLSEDIVEVESSLIHISDSDHLDTSFLNSAIVYNTSDTSSVQNVEFDTSSSVELDMSSSVDLDMSSSVDLDMSGSSYLINSPLSADEIDSILSGSEPPSPSSNEDPDYIPDDILETSSKSLKLKAPKTSKSKSKRSQIEPYEIPTEGLSKKEKKRIQNKNAAIRYRMKKKMESTQVQSEEDLLLEKNTKLKEQVEQIQREIEYMKNLMSDVCKAKGLKLKFVKK